MQERDEEFEATRRHLPVLLDRCIELLAPGLSKPGAVFVDCTLGMGGHTEGVLAAFPDIIAIGIDRDPQALELASERLARFGDRFRAVHAVVGAEKQRSLAGGKAARIRGR